MGFFFWDILVGYIPMYLVYTFVDLLCFSSFLLQVVVLDIGKLGFTIDCICSAILLSYPGSRTRVKSRGSFSLDRRIFAFFVMGLLQTGRCSYLCFYVWGMPGAE